MRVPVYRNLDSPFQVGGFKPLELVFICCFFVISSELSGTLGFSRVWAILLTFAAAGSVYWTRRSLGDEFPRRVIRFLSLPNQLYARPFWTRHK
jgi:hypothetical protein